MKEYKYCKCCNTKHKPETDICPNCGAKLDEKIYSNRIGLPLICAFVVTAIAYFIRNYYFEKKGITTFNFDFAFIIIFFLLMCRYFIVVLNSFKMGIFSIYLDFMISILRIDNFLNLRVSIGPQSTNDKVLKTTQDYLYSTNNKFIYSLFYLGILCLFFTIYYYVYFLVVEPILIICFIMLTFILPIVWLPIATYIILKKNNLK